MNYELCINDKDFIKKHLKDDVNKLALSKFPEGVDKQFVIRQIQARQVLSKKLPSWAENDELIFPKKLSLEQCSSELTAKYKSSLVKGKTLIDLTGGMGVDTAFLSDNFDKTFYVEMQEELCEIAKHNFKVLKKNIEVVNDNAEHFLTICDEVDCIYLDPARRDEYGRKMVSLHDCSPDVVELHDLLLEKAKSVLIKVSPMLDIEMVKKELKDISSIHVVAVRNECKEILIKTQRRKDTSLREMVGFAAEHGGPVAIRYPNATEPADSLKRFAPVSTDPLARVSVDFDPDSPPEYIFLTYGPLIGRVCDAADMLRRDGASVGIVLIETLKPYGGVADKLLPILSAARRVVYAEEGIRNGGAAEITREELYLRGLDFSRCEYRIAAIEDNFASPDTPSELYDFVGLSAEKLYLKMKD